MENERLCFSVLSEYTRLLRDWKVYYAPVSPEEEPDERFVESCHELDYMEYLLDMLGSGDSYERTEVVNKTVDRTSSKKKSTRGMQHE